ncbi:MAG: 4Fe-4S binding protein [Gammaproteobacteria bacterium]|nr:MAG: 4Fe-4S binding protein [Gammaproteobacteria bacterium]
MSITRPFKSVKTVSYIRFVWCLLLLIATTSFCSASENKTDQLIQSLIPNLFDDAVSVGDKLSDVAAWPVYNDDQLLGYAFQSTDLVDLRGFAGKPVNLLIGIDTSGTFQGVKVLEHHEPMFNHDLVGAMQRFVNQYKGLGINTRIIIDNGSKGHPGEGAKEVVNGTAQFDGISKATISLAVVNKTVLSSALHVARQKIAAYQQQRVVAKEDVYTPMTWRALLDQSLIQKWTITRHKVERATGLPLKHYADPNIDLSNPDADLNFHYGYLNSPLIGKNLLGEASFKSLKKALRPGEQAIVVFADGFYDYLGVDFIPNTEAKKLFIEQQGLRIPLLDMDFFDRSFIAQAQMNAGINNVHIFKIPASFGLQPNKPMQFTLNMDLLLPNGRYLEARFQDSYALPENLFELLPEDTVETEEAIWKGIWKNRSVDIAILIVSLVLLTIIFIKQQAASKQTVTFQRFRWGFLFFTLFFIGFYAQGQLSVINIYTLLLETWRGFNLEFFLLDPIIFILWVFTVVSLVLWGRGLFCGWLCPFGALQEMAAWLGTKLKLKQIRISPRLNTTLIKFKYVIFIALIASAFYSSALTEQLSEVEPFKTSMTFYFIRSWPFVAYALLLLLAGMFIHKFYCRFICPLGAGLAIVGKFHIFEWLNRRRECGSPCQVCRHRCGINAIDREGNIDYNECIQCLECIVIINDDKQCAPAMVANKKSSVRPVKFVEPMTASVSS